MAEELLIVRDVGRVATAAGEKVDATIALAKTTASKAVTGVSGAISKTVDVVESGVHLATHPTELANKAKDLAVSGINAAYTGVMGAAADALSPEAPLGAHQIYGVNTKILGGPPRFSKSCDPDSRIYSNYLLPMSFVCNVVPGGPVFPARSFGAKKREIAESLIVKSEDRNKGDSGLWADKTPAELNANYYEDNNPKTSSVSKARDLRFYAFASDWLKYRNILNSLLSSVFAITTGLNFSNSQIQSYLDMSDVVLGEGLHFWCQSGTSVSESYSNEIGPSMLESTTNTLSGMAKEFNFLTGKSGISSMSEVSTSGAEVADGSNALQGFASGAQETIGKVAGFMSGSAEQLILGENLSFPQIPKSSRFMRSVTLSFLFKSPSGDPKSCVEHVLVPMLAWMPMILPYQSRPDSYATTMLVRAESPGQFVIDMGVVTQASITKGGSKKLFTADGLPREIAMEVTISDLYPILTAPADIGILEGSIGTQVWLQNMTGLLMTRLNIEEQFKTSVLGRMYQFAGAASGDRLVASAGDRISRFFSGFGK